MHFCIISIHFIENVRDEPERLTIRKRGTDYSKTRRVPEITSVWARRVVREQFDITTFMKEGCCCLFDTNSDYSVAEKVWDKLTNALILAALSKQAASSRPLIRPFTSTHLEHPR